MNETTDPVQKIRDRLTALNIKAYYLLVAFSFLFSKNATLSLKWALTLTAIVAVLPVQDGLNSRLTLNLARWSKVILLAIALGCALWWVWSGAITTTAAAQKLAPPQAPEQQKPNESAGVPESRLTAIEKNADRALMEKDYIERIQKEVNTYYEKAFNTQLATVTIIALIVGLIGKFGVDHIVQSKLAEASNKLREDFTVQLTLELQKLKDSNTAGIKVLQDDLQERMSELEDDVNCRIYYNFYFAQGQAAGADGRHEGALDSFRRALKTYKSGKPRKLFATSNGGRVLKNIFVSIKLLYESNFTEEAKKELASELYDDLEDELAHAALALPWLSPLVTQRVLAKPTTGQTYPSNLARTKKAPDDKAEAGGDAPDAVKRF